MRNLDPIFLKNALQKTSFRVDDLDRSKGIYFVTLLDYKKEKQETNENEQNASKKKKYKEVL